MYPIVTKNYLHTECEEDNSDQPWTWVREFGKDYSIL